MRVNRHPIKPRGRWLRMRTNEPMKALNQAPSECLSRESGFGALRRIAIGATTTLMYGAAIHHTQLWSYGPYAWLVLLACTALLGTIVLSVTSGATSRVVASTAPERLTIALVLLASTVLALSGLLGMYTGPTWRWLTIGVAVPLVMPALRRADIYASDLLSIKRWEFPRLCLLTRIPAKEVLRVAKPSLLPLFVVETVALLTVGLLIVPGWLVGELFLSIIGLLCWGVIIAPRWLEWAAGTAGRLLRALVFVGFFTVAGSALGWSARLLMW